VFSARLGTLFAAPNSAASDPITRDHVRWRAEANSLHAGDSWRQAAKLLPRLKVSYSRGTWRTIQFFFYPMDDHFAAIVPVDVQRLEDPPHDHKLEGTPIVVRYQGPLDEHGGVAWKQLILEKEDIRALEKILGGPLDR
jgi:hypothetical protein